MTDDVFGLTAQKTNAKLPAGTFVTVIDCCEFPAGKEGKFCSVTMAPEEANPAYVQEREPPEETVPATRMVLFGPVAESQSTGICQYCVEVHAFSIPAVELKQVEALVQKKGDPCVPGAVRALACEGTTATDAKAHIPNMVFFMTIFPPCLARRTFADVREDPAPMVDGRIRHPVCGNVHSRRRRPLR